MDAVRRTYLALGLLTVNNKHTGGGCPKFYVTKTHKYSWKYSMGDYAKLRSFIGKILKSESSCLCRASLTIKTLYCPTDAQIYNS